uniref:hypothetical protein n=1 Tax=Enterocloster clostridioformis TaxID=1531 RepID=UPI0025A67A2F|nr:hypothetical protein [Enterocloster clostridioformis]
MTVGESSGWASATLKEVPFWRDDMSPEEYDREREYYAENFHLLRAGTYLPLWVQEQGEEVIQAWRELRYKTTSQ